MSEPRIDLEQARRRAKELLTAAKAGDSAAVKRMVRRRDPLRLADAQLTITRELGFPSWPALVAASGGPSQVLRWGSATHTRRVRPTNQDQFLTADALFVVADGMGGHAGGEVASAVAVDALHRGFTAAPTADGLREAAQQAQRAVLDRAAAEPALTGMGTTVTAVAVVADHMAVLNVGDSRVYLFHDGMLTAVTDDDSVAADLLRRGDITPEEAATHPQRNILTRVIGMPGDVDPDVSELSPEPGDRLLLCSDGLFNELADNDIAGVLGTVRDPSVAAEALIALANGRGGRDNITAVVLDVGTS